MLHYFATSSQRPCKGVNGKGCFVTKYVSNHHAQNKCDVWVYLWYRNHCSCSIKTLFALCCHHNRQCLMRAEDSDLFRNIGGSAIWQTRSANKNHRLARQVNVLLIFSNVAGNWLIRQLRQLDTHFLGSYRVKAVTHNCPISTRRCKLLCGLSYLWSHLKYAVHCIWHSAQCSQKLMPSSVGARSKRTRQRTRQQSASRNLRIKCLCTRNTHLYVTSVRGVQHAIGFGCQFATPTINYGQHRSSARTR